MMRTKLLAVMALVLCFALPATAEEVQIKLGDLRLNGNLVKAGDSWPTGPVILMTHGTLAHGGMEIMRTLQGLLEERGISTLAINLSLGADDRHGMYDCKAPHTHLHTDALLEIGAWVGWLQEQGVERMALLGHSRGGNQTARYLAKHTDTPAAAAILIAPSTWDEAKAAAAYEKRYGTPLSEVLAEARALVEAGRGDELVEGVDFIYCEDAQATADAVVSYHAPDPEMDTPYLIADIDVPVHVIAGSEDTVVEGLVDKVEPMTARHDVELVVIDGADHFFRDLYAEDVADYIADIFESP